MRKGERIWAVGLVIILVLLILLPIVGFVAWLGPNYEYENAVGGHMDNARTASTPEQLMSEIENALEGVDELGLEDDDYGAYFHWWSTEQVRVGYQTERLENITVRLEEIIEWRDTNVGTDQEMQDVYNKKFINIRNYVSEVTDVEESSRTIDDIIENAWFAKEHAFVYLWPMMWILLLVMWISWMVMGFIRYR